MNSSMRTHQVYRLALYGVRSSGKTCILSALTLPRVPHPDHLSCSWIENVPGHPFPAEDPDNWNTDDPFLIGWKWLHEQRNRLRRGDLPAPNPIREEAMRFLYAFGAPNQGTRYVELLDYSGELITATTSELAARLRHHMRDCDGLLVLAEVPSPGHEQAPLAEDLEKLKGAFLLLLNERDTGPQPEWPIALLFNKWDRRTDAHRDCDGCPSELVDVFLKLTPPPPHVSLVQTLHNAVGSKNVRCFPVSAFGAHQIRSDGAEVPLLKGTLLQSQRLEDGFIWVMDRCEELRVERLEQTAHELSWYVFCNPFPMKAEVDDGRPTQPWRRWLRRVFPGLRLLPGWMLLRQLSKGNELRSRVAQALRLGSLKLASQIGVLMLMVFMLISLGQAITDGVNYRAVLATQADQSASLESLQKAEAWLEEYYRASGSFRWLSHLFLSRSQAFDLLDDLRTRRDEMLWKAVTDAGEPQIRVKMAQEYLKHFPVQGQHSQEAAILVAEAARQEGLTRNREYLDRIARKIEGVEVRADTDLQLLSSLDEEIDRLPYQQETSEDLQNQQSNLHKKLSTLRDRVIALKGREAWEKFKQTYISLMYHNNFVEAAKQLVTRQPPEPELEGLKQDFRLRAPESMQKRVREEVSRRAYDSARDALLAFCDNPNIIALISAADLKALQQLRREIDEKEDQDLYAQILKYRPQCADQVSSYLTQAPLKTMQRHVEAYQQWLYKMNSPLDLTLTLMRIDWHAQYYGLYTLRNDIAVMVNGQPFLRRVGIVSKYNSYSDLSASGQLRAALNDTITIKVGVTARYGTLWDSLQSGGSGSWTGTVDRLRSGVTIDLPGDGFTNRATFSLSGIPPEPELPEWTRP